MMNIRSGVDVVKISRIEKAIKKTPAFLERVLTKGEIEYAMSKKNATNKNVSVANTVAGLFAAKEAISKALGTGLLGGIGFKDIEIAHKNGAPVPVLSEKAQSILGKNYVCSVSISHDCDICVANSSILEW